MNQNRLMELEDAICEWFGADKEAEMLLELARFQKYVIDGKGRRLQSLQDGNLCIEKFWSGLNAFPMIQIIARDVFSCVSSSAAAERNFSAHKFIHPLHRNRLLPDKVEMLLFLFFNQKNKIDEEQQEELEEMQDYKCTDVSEVDEEE